MSETCCTLLAENTGEDLTELQSNVHCYVLWITAKMWV